jgi:uncharacterized protein YjiS (DUF1127 family)
MWKSLEGGGFETVARLIPAVTNLGSQHETYKKNNLQQLSDEQLLD